MTTRTRRKLSPLDIIGEHKLSVTDGGDGTLNGRCSCHGFDQYVNQCNTAQERLTDAFLKHVQSVRDAMRGQAHV